MNESTKHETTTSVTKPTDAAALHQMPFRWVMLALVNNSWRLTFVCYGVLAFVLAFLWLLLANIQNKKIG